MPYDSASSTSKRDSASRESDASVGSALASAPSASRRSRSSDRPAPPPVMTGAGCSSTAPQKGTPVAELMPQGFYSGQNRVPRIESYWELYPEKYRTTPPTSPTAEDLETQRKRKIRENSRDVTDPITGKKITICDAKYDPPEPAPNTPKDIYPSALWAEFMAELRSITVKYIAFVTAAFVILNGCIGLPFSITIIATIGGGVTWWRNIDHAWDAFCSYAETEHGKKKMRMPGIQGNEPVEWLNGVVAKLWPQINPDLFTPIVDLLEDVMQASIPSFITQLKIVNVGQGATPVRVLSMRWLDDGEDNIKTRGDNVIATDRLNEEEQLGEWASLEVSFAYRAQPSSSSARSKAKNANLLVHFYMGLNGLFGTPIPVWVELRGVIGTARMKIQMVPDPPFIKLGTFTLLGMPKIEISAVPMNQRFLNVMNLPVVSDFINSSIKAAARQFVAPSNYTLDLSKLLVGDDTKKELLAIGALRVHVMSATGVMAADVNGKSDCYVTLSYAKCAKPLWSTRIIFGDLNPIWDETALLLLYASEVKAAERLMLTLYDSDRFTADDILGKTSIDVATLISRPGHLFELDDNLTGIKEGSSMPGKVKWSVTFYHNRNLNKELETTTPDPRIPVELQTCERPDKKDVIPKGLPEFDVTRVPPDPQYPAGILSIQLHNMVGLERHIISGSKSASGVRRGEAQTAQEEEEGENLPSAYCSVILNYQKIYRTRVKPMTSKPFFNAGTERFVRDWTQCKVMIVVKDSRLREEDPILGVVDLSLAEIFSRSSQVTEYYPIRGGIGYGKFRISLLFRSIDAQLPKSLLGADIGSVEIVTTHISTKNITDSEVAKADVVKFATPLIRKKATLSADGSSWVPVHNMKGSTGFRLGVRHRHSASCVLTFRRDSRIRRDKTLAVAVFWPKDLPDAETVTLTLPVYKPSNRQRLEQNYGVENGTHVGTVTFDVRFHRGLGHSHRRAAHAEKDFQEVIEATQCVEHIRGEEVAETASDNDASSSEDDGLRQKVVRKREEVKEMHRHERGVMQWKGARTLAWVGEGIKEKGRGMKGVLRMEPRRPEVESEIS